MERFNIPSQDATGLGPGDVETDFGAMARQLAEVYCEDFWPEGRTSPPMGGSRRRPFQLVRSGGGEAPEARPACRPVCAPGDADLVSGETFESWRMLRFGEWPDEVSQAFIPKEASVVGRAHPLAQSTLPSSR